MVGSLLLAGAAALALLVASPADQSAHVAGSLPPQVPVIRLPDAERARLFIAFADSITLRRDVMLATLASLDRSVADIVADTVLSEYTRTVGGACGAAEARLFPVRDGERTCADLPEAALEDAVQDLEQTFVAGTDRAIDGLARAAAQEDAEVPKIRARLYARIAGRIRVLLWGIGNRGDGSLDALDLFRQECARHEPLHRLEAELRDSAAVITAVSEFERAGETYARLQLGRVAEIAAASVLADDERIPASLREEPGGASRATDAWRAANDELASAFERSLDSAGDPLPAALWRIAYLERRRGDALPASTDPRRLVDMAYTLGLSDAERAAVDAIIADTTVRRADLDRRIVAEFDAWARSTARSGAAPYSIPPTQRMIAAYEELESLSTGALERTRGTIRSEIVRSAIVVPAERFEDTPLWWRLWSGTISIPGVAWGNRPATEDLP